jgi:small conductance mechanosensitive channel
MMDFSIDTIVALLTTYGLRIIGAILIFYIGKKVAKWISNIAVKGLQKSGVDETLCKFLTNVIYGVLIAVVILAALSNLGVETSSFVAMFGAVGLAVGLAFKDTFANVGAGVLLIVFRPFKVGDYITVGGESGTVEEINLFSVQLKTPDNKLIIMPNGSTVGTTIINYSAKATRRVDFVFGVGYEDDLKLVKSTLKEIISNDSRVLSDPEPFVGVSELADSSVNFVVRVWVKSEDYWGVYFDTIENVKLTFDSKGISIPYPQMDIHQK